MMAILSRFYTRLSSIVARYSTSFLRFYSAAEQNIFESSDGFGASIWSSTASHVISAIAATHPKCGRR
jgi:hypothetical protein